MKDEDEHEEALNSAHKSGIAQGLERAAALVMLDAKGRFQNGKDEQARELRALSVGVRQLH